MTKVDLCNVLARSASCRDIPFSHDESLALVKALREANNHILRIRSCLNDIIEDRGTVPIWVQDELKSCLNGLDRDSDYNYALLLASGISRAIVDYAETHGAVITHVALMNGPTQRAQIDRIQLCDVIAEEIKVTTRYEPHEQL